MDAPSFQGDSTQALVWLDVVSELLYELAA